MHLAFCKKEIKLNVIINLLLNGAIASFVFAPLAKIALIGNGDTFANTIAFDLGLGTFLVAFFVCFFTMFNIEKAMKKNSLTGLTWDNGSFDKQLTNLLPQGKLKTTMVSLIFAFGLFYLPTVFVVHYGMEGTMSGMAYTIYKTLYFTVLAFLLAYAASRNAVTDKNTLQAATA
nr:hypothetical protein [Endozoicomonas sp.]